MDAQTVIAGIVATLAIGGAIVGIAMHAGNSRHVAEHAMHTAKNVATAHHGYVVHADSIYARKDTIGPQLEAMRDALDRIESRQSTLVDRLIGPSV